MFSYVLPKRKKYAALFFLSLLVASIAVNVLPLKAYAVAAPVPGNGLLPNNSTTIVQTPSGEVSQQDCFTALPPTFNLEVCAAKTANFFMSISGVFLYVSGMLFNESVKTIVDPSFFFDRVPLVPIGWVVLRDLANITFIFILLWISISTILGLNSHGTKHLLVNLVIVALLLNFSLFITRAVFDASNIIALHFYDLITLDQNDVRRNIATPFMEALKISTLYDVQRIGRVDPSSPEFAALPEADRQALQRQLTGEGHEINVLNILLISIGGIVVNLIAAFVFFATAFMFLARSIGIMFLMILSPIAFVSYILPGMEEAARRWWHALIGWSFFVPVYMVLAYVVVRTINTDEFRSFTSNMAFSQTFSVGVGWQIVVNYFFICFALLAILTLATSIGGDKVTGFGITVAKGARNLVFSKGGGWAGRNFLARANVVPMRNAEGKWKMGTIRDLDEKFGESKFGVATGFGKGLRKMTTQKLVNAQFGGKSAEEVYHEGKLEKEAGEAIDTRNFVLKNIGEAKGLEEEVTKAKDRFKIWQDAKEKAKKAGQKLSPEDEAQYDQAEAQLNNLKAKLSDKVDEIKTGVAKWSPAEFVKYTPEELLMHNPHLMEAVTTAQFDALIKDQTRHFDDKEKKEMTRMRFKNVIDAFEDNKKQGNVFKEQLKEYEGTLKKWEEDTARFKREMDAWKAMTPDQRKGKNKPKKPLKPRPPLPPSFPKDIYEKFSRMPTNELAYLKNADPDLFTHPYFAPNLKWGQIGKMPSDPSFPPDYHREIRKRKDAWGRYALDMMLGIDPHIDPTLDKDVRAREEEKIIALRKARQRLVNAGVDLKTGKMYDGRDITAELKKELVDMEGKTIDDSTWTLASLTDEERARIPVGQSLVEEWKYGRSNNEIPMGRSEVRNDPNLLMTVGRDVLNNYGNKDKVDIKNAVQPIVAAWKRHTAARERNPGSKDFYINEGNLEFLNWLMNDPQKRGQQFYDDPEILGDVDPAAVEEAFKEMRTNKKEEVAKVTVTPEEGGVGAKIVTGSDQPRNVRESKKYN